MHDDRRTIHNSHTLAARLTRPLTPTAADHGRVIRSHELSDAEWDFVRPLLPPTSMGRPRLDDRTMLNGIVWKFRAGVAWRGVPERYGWEKALFDHDHCDPGVFPDFGNLPTASREHHPRSTAKPQPTTFRR
ncbi:transposase [Streptomyces flavidovirens]|uniref:transposase n=1 Tax=Streptomyces flavidovirens TaxID=67298 RepID=UPI0036B48935